MNRERVSDEIESFVSQELLEGEDIGLTNDTPLLEYGLIDSVSLVMLNDHIEDEFGVRIPNVKLTPENLKTIETITNLVVSLGEE